MGEIKNVSECHHFNSLATFSDHQVTDLGITHIIRSLGNSPNVESLSCKRKESAEIDLQGQNIMMILVFEYTTNACAVRREHATSKAANIEKNGIS